MEALIKNDENIQDFIAREYPHIWVPYTWSSDEMSGHLNDTRQVFFDETFILYYEQLRTFHNMYVSILDADKKEEENNRDIFDFTTNNRTDEQKRRFIERKNIFHNIDNDTLQWIHFSISDPTYRLSASDRSYFLDSAFYTLFFAFIESVLKDFVHTLQDNKPKKTKTFIKKIEKDMKKEHEGDCPKYIILATCIDRICRMKEITSFLDTKEFGLFKAVRNERTHDLLMNQNNHSKLTICDCFFLTKKLLTKLSTCKKIYKKLFDTFPQYRRTGTQWKPQE